MIATIISERKKHYPVLLNEIISIITPQYGGTFIDCTFGQGGYTKKILEFANTKIIALDRDKDTEKIALDFEKKFKTRFLFKNKKFSEINDLDLRKEKIKAVVFDLGYSYTQIKDPKKGLSFDASGELNMKMGLNNFSAKDVINKLNKKDLEKIFKFFGEEKDSKRIAYKIIKERKIKEIDTQKLVKIIESSKRKKNYKIHSATKVFQALRIFVNKEITELIYGLICAAKVVDEGGIIVAVSFLSACDIRRACNPILESPISPSISDFGVRAATESITTKSIAPELIKWSAISNACSPLSGWEINKLSVSTPREVA